MSKNDEFKLKRFHVDIHVTRIANVHYFEFTNKYFTAKDRHPFKELVYVDSGSIDVESEGYRGTLYPKQTVIHKRSEEHSLSCTGDAPNVIIIGFECDCERLDVFSQTPVTLTAEQIRILTDIIKEGRAVFLPPYDVPNVKDMKKRKQYPFGADQMLKLKLEMLLIEMIRSTEMSDKGADDKPSDSKIDEIYNYICAHYSERITLDNLCFLFGTNKTTVCKNFKQQYGDTIISFIHKLRIQKAKKLMREGNLNLTQLSAQVGFSSIHYFSKTFKSYEHRSPSEYMHTVKLRLEP